jgi:hypothetical protein
VTVAGGRGLGDGITRPRIGFFLLVLPFHASSHRLAITLETKRRPGKPNGAPPARVKLDAWPKTP